MGILDYAGGTPSGGSSSAASSSAKVDKTATKQITSEVNKRLNSRDNQSPTLLNYANSGKQDYAEQKKSAFDNPVANGFMTVLKQFGRPSSAIQSAIQARYGSVGDVLRAAGHGFTDTSHQIGLRESIIAPQVLGQQGWANATDEQKAAAEKFARDQGGLAGKIVDFAGTTATDPTLGIGGGGNAVARAGGKVVARELGQDVAKQVATKGLRSFSDADRQAITEVLRNAPEAAAARGGPERYVSRMVGGDAKFLGRETGALEQAQAAPLIGKFGGQTIIPKAATDALARGTGLEKLGNIVKDSRVGQGVADTFSTGAKVAREINPESRDITQDVRQGAVSEAAIKSDDLRRNIETIAKKIPNIDKFEEETLLPALEQGKHVEVAQALRQQGRTAEADLVDATDKLRQSTTDERLASGQITQKELHNRNTYVPWTSTDDFSKWLRENSQRADELFGYRPAQNGVLRSAETHFRSLPYQSVNEANAHVAAATNGAVTKAFETSPTRALAKEAGKTYDRTAILKTIDGLSNEVNPATGEKLLIHGVDNSKQIKELAKEHKGNLKEIDKQIKKVDRTVAKESVAGTGYRRELRAAEATLQQARKAFDKAQEAVAKAGNRTIAAGTDQRTARELGTTTKWQGDELVGTAVNKAPSVQQRIGATRSSSKYEALLSRKADAQLRTAQQEMQTASRRYDSLAANAPASSKDALAALREQKKQLKESFRSQRDELTAAQKVDHPLGYVKLNIGPEGKFGHVYGHPALVKTIEEFEGKVKSPKEANLLGQGLEAFNHSWKNLTLNFPVFAAGRNVRDGVSNMVQMWQRDILDPKAFAPAGRIVVAVLKGRKAGLSRAEAFAKLSPEDRALAEVMDTHGSLVSGQIQGDIRHAPLRLGDSGSKRSRAWERIDPRNAESVATKLGASANDALDMFSRAAGFTAGYWKHGDGRIAAQLTDDALFNYRNITDSEKWLKTYVAPFYTFLRKNAGLQAWAISHVPQKSLFIQRLKDDLANEDATGTDVLSAGALSNFQRPLGRIGGTGILGTIETPDEAAAKQAQNLIDIGSYALPEKYVTQKGLQGGSAGILSNVGGAVGTVSKDIAQEASHSNLYTGAPLSPTKYDAVKRNALSLVPRGSQIDSGQSISRKGTAAERASYIGSLLGVSNTANTEKRQTGELYRRKRVIEDSATRQGIPTAAALKKRKKS